MKLVLESNATIKGRTIEGIALVPTVSRNGNIYSEEEILAVEGLEVPLKADWEHTDEEVGKVVFTLDESIPAIRYKAEINSTREIKEGVHKVSIEADVKEAVPSCTRQRCYNLLSGITLEGIGITATPGVTQTTLTIIESSQEWKSIEKNCDKCHIITENEKIENMEKEITELKSKVETLSKPKCQNCGKIKIK